MIMYTKEEVNKLMGMAFHIGVEAGEKGIPEDFKSYNPEHMEWYAQKGLEMKEYLFKNEKELLKM